MTNLKINKYFIVFFSIHTFITLMILFYLIYEKESLEISLNNLIIQNQNLKETLTELELNLVSLSNTSDVSLPLSNTSDVSLPLEEKVRTMTVSEDRWDRFYTIVGIAIILSISAYKV
jgi:hypothetical protein